MGPFGMTIPSCVPLPLAPSLTASDGLVLSKSVSGLRAPGLLKEHAGLLAILKAEFPVLL